MAKFEEDYLDVLQNIEAAIVSVYRQHPALLDYEVDKALEALIRAYQAEQQQRTLGATALTPSRKQSMSVSVRSVNGDWGEKTCSPRRRVGKSRRWTRRP